MVNWPTMVVGRRRFGNWLLELLLLVSIMTALGGHTAAVPQGVNWDASPQLSLSITLEGPKPSKASATVSLADRVVDSKTSPDLLLLHFSLDPRVTHPNSTVKLEIQTIGVQSVDIKYILQVVGGRVAIGPAAERSRCEAPTVSLRGDATTALKLQVPIRHVHCGDYEIAAGAQSLGGTLLVRPMPGHANVRVNGAMQGSGSMALFLPWDRDSTIAFEAFRYVPCLRKVRVIRNAPYMLVDGSQVEYQESTDPHRMSVLTCTLTKVSTDNLSH